MSDTMKVVVIVVVMLYLVSLVDALPGPLDDIIVLLLGFGARKRLVKND